MPTSLVSTGVQFPDSTIQTTAATGSPNYNQIGTTIFWCSSNSATYPVGLSAAGLRWATTNISTTQPTLIASPPVELQVSTALTGVSPSGTGSSFVGATTGQDGALANSTNYTAVLKLVRDGYTGRYTLSDVRAAYGSYSTIFTAWTLAYTSDFVVWYPYRNASSGSDNTPSVSAFNHYTGTRIFTNRNFYDNTNTFYRTVAASAYDTNTTTNTFDVNNLATTWQPGRIQTLGFIDTGTQSTSFFYVVVRGISFPYYVTFLKSSGTNDGATGTWTQATGLGSSNGSLSRVVGSTAEIMFWSYNGGMFSSTDLGATWTKYSFGDTTFGTSNNYYTRSTAWNGTRWLAINSNNTRLCTKLMGSGTSWTDCAQISGETPAAVAYNPTYSVWVFISNAGRVYTNSNSDPTSGGWTYVNQLTTNSTGLNWGIIVVGANTTNFA
jgi:hypothetical protein